MKRTMVIVVTVLNALLFIGTIVCTAWTCRNNKIINSANSIFAYREEKGEVLFVLKDAEEVRLRFDENSVKIVQSYAHDGAENIFRMVLFVREYARGKGYEIERTVTEMYGEIRLHNILYRLGYIYKPEDVKKEILALARDLPKEGRITYGSKDMEPYRARVDKIVQMLLATDKRARKANERFFRALAGREREIANICGQPFAYSNKNVSPEKMESDLPKYHNVIDGKNIRIVEEIKADYKRRQGNLVLKLAKFIKPEYYENKRKRKAGDNGLKRSLGISRRNTGRAINKFLSSFGAECEFIERDYCRRLQEIEEEMKREKEKKDAAEHDGETK